MQFNTGIRMHSIVSKRILDQGVMRDAGYFYGPTQPRTYFFGVEDFLIKKHLFEGLITDKSYRLLFRS